MDGENKTPATAGIKSVRERVQRLEALARIERARADINDFIEYAFRTAPEQYVRQGAIHRKWHAHVDKHPFSGIIAPRDHGKSQQMVIYRIIWELGKNPAIRIKLVSNDLPKAKKRLRAIRVEIDMNPRIREVFPNLKANPDVEDWTAATMTVNRDIAHVEPSLEARGVLTAATGGRADLIIFDDVCDLKNSIKNPKDREAVISAVKEDWLNLLEPTGRAIYIATPWHPKDLTHDLMRAPDWRFIKIVINENLDPIWPEHWPRDKLQARRQLVGDLAFARGYLCKTILDVEDTLFREEDLEAARDYLLHVRDAIKMAEEGNWPVFIGVDPASGKRTRSARYQVIFTVAVDPRNSQRVLLDIQRKREKAPRFIRRIKDIAERFNASCILVENNATQDALIDLAKQHDLKSLPVKAIHTGKEKMDPNIGLPALAAEFESNLWRIPYGNDKGPKAIHADTCKCTFCLFLNECREGITSEYTDLMMAAWIATRLIRRKGLASVSTAISGGRTRSAPPAEWDASGRNLSAPAQGKFPAGTPRGKGTHFEPGW